MLKLSSRVAIAGLRFAGITAATVSSSWDMLTDTASVTLPRHAWFEGKRIFSGSDALVRRGSEVSIQLGYDDRLHSHFSGYVRSVSTATPVEVECEDAMYLLKATRISRSYRSVTLDALLADILPASIPFRARGVSLGPFRIDRASVAEVLKQLRQQYTLKSFLRGGTLYVGLAYWPELQTRHTLRFDRHVPAGAGDQLEWRERDDVRIRLKAVVIRPDNSREEFEYGDADGEQRTLFFYDVPATDVQAMAEEEIERLRYSGFRGSLQIFGEPFVQHGDIVELFDKFAPERGGAYLVKQVDTAFGSDGFRQTLTLDSRAS